MFEFAIKIKSKSKIRIRISTLLPKFVHVLQRYSWDRNAFGDQKSKIKSRIKIKMSYSKFDVGRSLFNVLPAMPG